MSEGTAEQECGIPKGKEALLNWITKKANKHQSYKYYSKTAHVKSVLDKGQVVLSDGSDWNDLKDRERFTDTSEGYKRFGLCLSYSRSENVAMWMLYAKEGAMINYPKSTIQEILNAKRILIGPKEKIKEYESSFRELKEHFEISILDVVYFGDSTVKPGNAYYVRRSDTMDKDYSKEIVDSLTYQKKELPWSYENECRIVVSVENEAVKEDDNVVIIQLSETEKNILKNRVVSAPDAKDTEFPKGKLAGKIEWDLCQKCVFKEKSENSVSSHSKTA